MSFHTMPGMLFHSLRVMWIMGENNHDSRIRDSWLCISARQIVQNNNYRVDIYFLTLYCS